MKGVCGWIITQFSMRCERELMVSRSAWYALLDMTA